MPPASETTRRASSPAPAGPDLVFYDGHCALCHRAVRFLLTRDPAGEFFRFAPLSGETLRTRVDASRRAALPDSLVLLTVDGTLLTRSQAVLYALRRLGGSWGRLARWLAWIPRPLRDLAYDAVARVRRALFARPAGVCPVVPAALRERFLP